MQRLGLRLSELSELVSIARGGARSPSSTLRSPLSALPSLFQISVAPTSDLSMRSPVHPGSALVQVPGAKPRHRLPAASPTNATSGWRLLPLAALGVAAATGLYNRKLFQGREVNYELGGEAQGLCGREHFVDEEGLFSSQAGMACAPKDRLLMPWAVIKSQIFAHALVKIPLAATKYKYEQYQQMYQFLATRNQEELVALLYEKAAVAMKVLFKFAYDSFKEEFLKRARTIFVAWAVAYSTYFIGKDLFGLESSLKLEDFDEKFSDLRDDIRQDLRNEIGGAVQQLLEEAAKEKEAAAAKEQATVKAASAAVKET